jgi:hypothetical protein
MTTFHILWPEVKDVSSDTIEMWYADAVANDEIDADLMNLNDNVEKAKALDDAGLITLGLPGRLPVPKEVDYDTD